MKVRGIVQGVGFRPFIYQLAGRCGLNGWVRNQSDGVEIEVAGPAESVGDFIRLDFLRASSSGQNRHD